MVTIIFEAHNTTYDNEKRIASGHFDAELSPLGMEQAQELGKRYKGEHFDAIFCSDLKRSYTSAQIAVGTKFPIIQDSRLRESNYGTLTRHPMEEIEQQKMLRIKEPFPRGESYEQTTARVRNFLQDLLKTYDGKKVMSIGRRATQYGLEHCIKGIPLETVVTARWQWQPGWRYELQKL